MSLIHAGGHDVIAGATTYPVRSEPWLFSECAGRGSYSRQHEIISMAATAAEIFLDVCIKPADAKHLCNKTPLAIAQFGSSIDPFRALLF